MEWEPVRADVAPKSSWRCRNAAGVLRLARHTLVEDDQSVTTMDMAIREIPNFAVAVEYLVRFGLICRESLWEEAFRSATSLFGLALDETSRGDAEATWIPYQDQEEAEKVMSTEASAA